MTYVMLNSADKEPLDLSIHGPGLELLTTPTWFYDVHTSTYLWGNRAASKLFNVQKLSGPQPEQLFNCSHSERQRWVAHHDGLLQLTEGATSDKLVTYLRPEDGPLPGCPGTRRGQAYLTIGFRPARLHVEGQIKTVLLAQVDSNFIEHDLQMRLVEMARNHPMFQFLFKEDGKLLAANQRAMANMQEHLGGNDSNYTLQQYLSLGEDEGDSCPEDMFKQMADAIFVEGKQCYRFSQLRWSRRPGKYRYVLFECWPLTDPVTGCRAVLVCEQNITQVKALEEQFKRRNQCLEAQLEEALAQRDQSSSCRSAIDTDTPADKTLQLLDKLMKGIEVSAREVLDLRDTIIQVGDLRQPVNLPEQLLAHSNDNEVSQSLIQLLSTRQLPNRSFLPNLEEYRQGPVVGHTGTSGGGGGGGGGNVVTGFPLCSYRSQGPRRTSNVSTAISLGGVSLSDHGLCEDGGSPGPATGSSGFSDDAASSSCLLLSGGMSDGCYTQDRSESDIQEMQLLVRHMPDEATRVLSRIDDWQYDSFQLVDVSGGRPLTMLSWALFSRCDLITKWGLNDKKLLRYLMAVENGYLDNPYHNRTHAADVLRSLHVLLTRGGLRSMGYCDDLKLLACFMAAIVHDFRHKGVNNDYLCRTCDPLAVTYNDRSPMENHHLAAAFRLLQQSDYNFLENVPAKTREAIRKQVIEMVLATDMKSHFSIHSQFQAKMQAGQSSSAGAGGSLVVQGGSGRGSGRVSNNGGGGGGGGGGAGGRASRQASPHTTCDHHVCVHPTKPDDEMKSLVLQVALKIADLGHLGCPRSVHRKWVSLLEEEFFRQGDAEKRAGLAVSPLMDRSKHGISKSQVGFFEIVSIPIYQSMAAAFPDCSSLLEAVRDNYQMWKEEAMMVTSASSSGRLTVGVA